MLSHCLSRNRQIHSRVRLCERGRGVQLFTQRVGCNANDEVKLNVLHRHQPHAGSHQHQHQHQQRHYLGCAALSHQYQYANDSVLKPTSTSWGCASIQIQPTAGRRCSNNNNSSHNYLFLNHRAVAPIRRGMSMSSHSQPRDSSSYQSTSTQRPSSSAAARDTNNIVKLTKKLLQQQQQYNTQHRQSNNNSNSSSSSFPLRTFEKILTDTRTNTSVLDRMQLSETDARNMFLLPPQLLKDVHMAILHFSKRENFQGMVIDTIPEATAAATTPDKNELDNDFWQDEPKKKKPMASSGGGGSKYYQPKVPGPIICTRLLELIGIPHYYRHVSLSSLPNNIHTMASSDTTSTTNNNMMTTTTTTTVVHSSQIDDILDCCLETNLALSRACEPGKFSLIGHGHDDLSSIPTLTEDIWKSIWNMEIKYTFSGDRLGEPLVSRTTDIMAVPSAMSSPSSGIRIGRIGSIGGDNSMVYNNPAAAKYLSDMQNKANEAKEDDHYHFDDHLADTQWGAMSPEQREAQMPWTMKDKRRYDQCLILFNSALGAYAKLSSSGSGVRSDIRKDMMQNAERLLLEAASKKMKAEGSSGSDNPSPATILQCLLPDTVSFNTVMKAWSEYSTKVHRSRANDEDSQHMANLAAERTESILKMMIHLWDEERSTRTTLESMQAAWDDNGQYAPYHSRAIAPNASSYNGVLKGWSRSSDPSAAGRAINVFQTMIHRSNIASLARESLYSTNTTTAADTKNFGLEALPDSRTFVLLLQSLQNLTVSMNFRDAYNLVENVFCSAQELDEQIQWSYDNGIVPKSHMDGRGQCQKVLNVFAYNTLFKTVSSLGKNWDECYECCLRIDNIIEEEMDSGDVHSVIPNAVTAWAKCAEKAGDDKERVKLCAERAGAYLDTLLANNNQTNTKQRGTDNKWGSFLIRAINDTIKMYGKAGEFDKADELFHRAKQSNTHNLATVSAVIDALCVEYTSTISNVEKAQQYLLDFEQDKMKQGSSYSSPDMVFTSMYNSVIAGYVTCDKQTAQGLDQAKDVLDHMISSHESNLRHIARPNTTSFARVMAVLARRGENTTCLEELLAKMEGLHQRRKNTPRSSPEADLVANVVPNIVIYNFLLKAYAKRNDDEAVQSSMKLLGKIEKEPGLKADDVTTSYIEQLQNGKQGLRGALSTKDTKPAGPRVTQFDVDNLKLDELSLQELTAKSFSSIMNEYATAGNPEAAEKGAALLRKLEDMHNSGKIPFKPDTYLYNKLMNAWYLCEQNNTDPSISYAEKTEQILDFLCRRDTSEGPDEMSFSICIHALARSNQSQRAEDILRQKEEFVKKHTDVEIVSTDFNHIISSWRQDPVHGSKRATLLFERMLQKYGDSANQTKPTVTTLNSLLDVYAKDGERNMAEQASTLINKMNELHEDGRGSILPDIRSYRSAIDAWVRSWHKDSATRADAIVQDMEDKYKNEGRTDLCPDTNVYNLILKACANAPAMWKIKSKEGNPIAIANRIFSLLKGKNDYGANATHATYSYMILLYRQHMDFNDKRFPTVIQNLWKHCIKDGLVSEFVLDALRKSVLDDEFWRLIGGRAGFVRVGKNRVEEITAKDLPKEWRKNVTADRNKVPKRWYKQIK